MGTSDTITLSPELVELAIKAQFGNVFDFCNTVECIGLDDLYPYLEEGIPITDKVLVGRLCAALKLLPKDLSFGRAQGMHDAQNTVEKTIRKLQYENEAGKITTVEFANASSKLLGFITPKLRSMEYLPGYEDRRISAGYPSLSAPLRMLKETPDEHAEESVEPESTPGGDERAGQ